jgi:hypothetical protein
MARSVVRLADQDAGRWPNVCVLSGEPTEHAARVTATQWEGRRWLLTVPGFPAVVGRLPGRACRRIALPVSAWVWRQWSRRNLAATAVVAAGLGLAAAGVLRPAIGLVVLGALLVAVGTVARARAAHHYWVTCRLRPATATVVVEPTHPAFDAQARALFARSLR